MRTIEIETRNCILEHPFLRHNNLLTRACLKSVKALTYLVGFGCTHSLDGPKPVRVSPHLSLLFAVLLVVAVGVVVLLVVAISVVVLLVIAVVMVMFLLGVFLGVVVKLLRALLGLCVRNIGVVDCLLCPTLMDLLSLLPISRRLGPGLLRFDERLALRPTLAGIRRGLHGFGLRAIALVHPA